MSKLLLVIAVGLIASSETASSSPVAAYGNQAVSRLLLAPGVRALGQAKAPSRMSGLYHKASQASEGGSMLSRGLRASNEARPASAFRSAAAWRTPQPARPGFEWVSPSLGELSQRQLGLRGQATEQTPAVAPSSGDKSGIIYEGPNDILNYMNMEADFTNQVRDTLIGFNIPEGKEITKEVLDKAFKEAGDKYKFMEQTLMNIDEHKEYCSMEIANGLLAIFKLKELQRFRSFFENHWRAKFELCEQLEVSRIKEGFGESDSYRKLREFLTAALNINEGTDEASKKDYLNSLKSVDLNEPNLEKSETLKVVDKYPETWYEVDENGREVKVDAKTKYVKFLTKKCWHAFYPLHTQFAVINLAQRFMRPTGGTPLASDGLEFTTINEWNRICLGWLNGGDGSDTQRIEIMRQSLTEL